MDLQGDTISQKMEITARFTFNSEVEDGVGVQTIPIKYYSLAMNVVPMLMTLQKISLKRLRWVTECFRLTKTIISETGQESC